MLTLNILDRTLNNYLLCMDFSFMDPSPIESTLSIRDKVRGPAIRDEIYFFTDKGDTRSCTKIRLYSWPNTLCSFTKINETAS